MYHNININIYVCLSSNIEAAGRYFVGHMALPLYIEGYTYDIRVIPCEA